MKKDFHISLTKTTIDIDMALNFCRDEQAGAINTFIGTVRNHSKNKNVSHLFFESYEPMALAEIEKIVLEAMNTWPLLRVVVVHRLGTVALGEEAVAIVTSSVHRKEGFAACEFIIDSLKKTVPIWKKEYYEGGEVWVSATP